MINTSEELALRLAELAKRIRGRVLLVLKHESEKGALRKLMKGFRTALIHDLDADQFADMYAQTITYGLFSAAVSRTVPGAGTAVVQENVADMVPVTNPFLKEMLETFLRAGGRKGKLDFDELGIQDVVELLNDTNTRLDAVLRDFGNKTRQEDPVIHFYEHFLAVYDKKLKVQRGVFYTPLPVVSYIVRSVHELLQTEFGLEDGLASTVTWGEMALGFPPPLAGEGKGGGIRIPDGTGPDEPFVQILDIATGTGTFFITVIEVIFQHLKAKFAKGGIAAMPRIHNPKSPIRNWSDYWNAYVPVHLLPRIFGYELMMAPYAIAHMRVPLKLKETGFTAWSELTEKNRVNIYLTNSLEPATDDKRQQEFEELAPALAHEARAVNTIKRKQRFTVVIGNPPYAGHSANASRDNEGMHNFIGALIHDYYFVDGAPLGEKNPKWLQDDYVKFLRLGQHLIQRTGAGMLGLITNHSYLDNPTFRGMRRNLMQSFNKLLFLDLHGNSKKKEVSPDGSKDENIFDIQQGVAICLLLRRVGKAPEPVPTSGLFHADLYRTRQEKYAWLSAVPLKVGEWERLSPNKPFYLFVPQDQAVRAVYERGWKVTDIFPLNSVGVVTGQDGQTIGFTVEEARHLADSHKLPADVVIPYMYRPFDIRNIVYDGHVVTRQRVEVMRHMLASKNVGLTVGRSGAVTGDEEWNLAFASSQIPDFNLYRRGGVQLCPLWRYPTENEAAMGFEKELNLNQLFLDALGSGSGLRFDPNTSSEYTNDSSAGFRAPLEEDSFSPEDAFNYIYGLLHSPTYRSRHSEFLKIDFPRFQPPGSQTLFRAISHLGGELVALHLMASPKLDHYITTYTGSKNPEVGRVGWANDTIWLDTPAKSKGQSATPGTIGFKGVREDVWNFHIGGYQVCEKWLKDRKGRTLSAEDIQHYHRIVVALSETIRLMAEIDTVIEQHGGWPGAFQGVTDVAEAAAAPENVVELQAKKPQPVEAYAPERTLLLKAAERGSPRERVTREQQTDDAPIPVDELDRADLMCMIRQLFGDGEPIPRDEAVKALSRQLGYDRVGTHIGEELDNAIRTAVRRGIVVRNGDSLSLLARSIEGYKRDFLKEQFLASLQGHSWTERDDAIRHFARWLGFRRTGQSIDESARSLINGLIRDGSLESEGGAIRRVP